MKINAWITFLCFIFLMGMGCFYYVEGLSYRAAAVCFFGAALVAQIRIIMLLNEQRRAIRGMFPATGNVSNVPPGDYYSSLEDIEQLRNDVLQQFDSKGSRPN